MATSNPSTKKPKTTRGQSTPAGSAGITPTKAKAAGSGRSSARAKLEESRKKAAEHKEKSDRKRAEEEEKKRKAEEEKEEAEKAAEAQLLEKQKQTWLRAKSAAKEKERQEAAAAASADKSGDAGNEPITVDDDDGDEEMDDPQLASLVGADVATPKRTSTADADRTPLRASRNPVAKPTGPDGGAVSTTGLEWFERLEMSDPDPHEQETYIFAQCKLPDGLPPTDYAMQLPVYTALILEQLRISDNSCGIINSHPKFEHELVYYEHQIPSEYGQLAYLIGLETKMNRPQQKLQFSFKIGHTWDANDLVAQANAGLSASSCQLYVKEVQAIKTVKLAVISCLSNGLTKAAVAERVRDVLDAAAKKDANHIGTRYGDQLAVTLAQPHRVNGISSAASSAQTKKLLEKADREEKRLYHISVDAKIEDEVRRLLTIAKSKAVGTSIVQSHLGPHALITFQVDYDSPKPMRDKFASIVDNGVLFTKNTAWVPFESLKSPDRPIVVPLRGQIVKITARDYLAQETVASKMKGRQGKSLALFQGTVIENDVVHVQVPKGYELEAKERKEMILAKIYLELKESFPEEKFGESWTSISKAFEDTYVTQAEQAIRDTDGEIVIPPLGMDDDEQTWTADDNEIVDMTSMLNVRPPIESTSPAIPASLNLGDFNHEEGASVTTLNSLQSTSVFYPDLNSGKGVTDATSPPMASNRGDDAADSRNTTASTKQVAGGMGS